MKFVKVQGAIYDYAKYKLSILNLTKALNDNIENSIAKFGFVKQKEGIFYNKKFDLLLQVSLRNKSRLKFV